MKYVALLRGINVGGNAAVSMAELRDCFEKLGYSHVLTYINSGNVIFESDEKDLVRLTNHIEKGLEKRFKMPLRIVVVSHPRLKRIVEEAPTSWKKGKDLRCYISFMISPTTVDDAAGEIEVKEGVDFLDKGKGVLYMGTTLSGLTKSGFVKLIQKKIYKEMTMRNFNTIMKILALMNAKKN